MAPASASAARLGSRTLSAGTSGIDVTALQGDLTATGFRTSITGAFGAQTTREVKAFQRRYHLQVDGVVGPATVRRLRKLMRTVNHITETNPNATGANGTVTTDQADAVPSGDVLPSADSGGVGFVPTSQNTAEVNATLIDGLAVAAPGTPQTIVAVINAANRIAFLPYIYGGGHSPYLVKKGLVQLDAGYDCSGSVSFALRGGDLLADPLASEQFVNYGRAGAGQWITIYFKGTYHVYMKIAGLWFDTAAQEWGNGDDRWSTTRISPAAGYVVRHPAGW